MDIATSNQNKRDDRVKQTAEVFTPVKLVEVIINKLNEFDEDLFKNKEKTFIDPACGNGNFLIEILLKKIRNGIEPLIAIKTVYGLYIMRDNIRECRLRLLKVISLYEPVTIEHIKIVFQNVRFLNTNKWKNGALDYDMSFRNNYNNKDIEEWYQKIQNGELDKVNLPVSDNDQNIGDIFAEDETDIEKRE